MPIKKVWQFYCFCRALFWLFLSFGRAVLHFQAKANLALDLPEGLAISAREKRRLKHYFFGTTYLAVLMCSLRNRARSPEERHLFTNLSALSYCFDDLVESFKTNNDSNILWQDNPEAYGLAHDKKGLALHLLHNIYKALPPKDVERFRDYMHRIYNLETAKKQHNSALNLEALQSITAEKGGASVLLFRSVLTPTLTAAEETALFEFGYLIQFSDDIFDLWHDRQANIKTLACFLAEHNDIAQLIRLFEQQVLRVYQAFRNTFYPKVQIETAIMTLHFLVSITRVCLQHYLDLQDKWGNLPLDNRSEMVVDMERWGNRVRAGRNLLQSLP